jgi:hypothetical protein
VGNPKGAPQIPPLRFAPVGMTKRRVWWKGEDRLLERTALSLNYRALPQLPPSPSTTALSLNYRPLLQLPPSPSTTALSFNYRPLPQLPPSPSTTALSFENRALPFHNRFLFVIPTGAKRSGGICGAPFGCPTFTLLQPICSFSGYSPVKGLVSFGLAVVGSGALAVSAASRAGPGPLKTR